MSGKGPCVAREADHGQFPQVWPTFPAAGPSCGRRLKEPPSRRVSFGDLLGYGTIGLVRNTDSCPVPTIPSGDLLLSWQMYSNSSVPALQRSRKPPVQVAV